MKKSILAGKNVGVAAGIVAVVAVAVAVAAALVPAHLATAAVVSIAGIAVSALYIRMRIAASTRQSVQEACNWHLAESHMFLDGQPFCVQGEEPQLPA
jgi:ABC-type Na+ efflux pump permease subunit